MPNQIQNDPSAAGNMMAGLNAKDQAAQGSAPKGQDPVIDALKTIQVAISALSQKGDPKAQAITEAFKALLSAFQGSPTAQNETEEGMEAPESPEASSAPASMPPRGSRPMAENQSSGTRPVL